MEKNVPVFVKISDYKEVLDIVDALKQKLKEADSTLEKLMALKAEEDKELQEWEKGLAEINKRITFIDNSFFENE